MKWRLIKCATPECKIILGGSPFPPPYTPMYCSRCLCDTYDTLHAIVYHMDWKWEDHPDFLKGLYDVKGYTTYNIRLDFRELPVYDGGHDAA